MSVLFDHLTSVLVAGVIILLLVVVHMRSQQTSVERTMAYMGKKHLLELADLLERDLNNAGYGTTPGQAGITAHTTRTDGQTDLLSFWGSDASGTQREIRYVLAETGSVTIDDETMPLFELQRSEKIAGVWTSMGGTTPTLTNFTVDLLNANNIPTTNLSEARRFRIRVSKAVMPDVGPDEYLKGYRLLHWGITLTPDNLGGYQGG